MTQTKQDLKQAIRSDFRHLRKQISSQQASQAGNHLCHHLVSLPIYSECKKIACFLSFDGEINTQPIINRLLEDKGHCYLPKLKPNKPNRLWFMPYKKETSLVANKLKIQEVDLPVNHAIAISKLDLILMPLVAFDIEGHRLGMGGGYYDATLAHLTDARNTRRPLCFGLAYQQQKVAKVPTQTWDFPLDGILTQTQIYLF